MLTNKRDAGAQMWTRRPQILSNFRILITDWLPDCVVDAYASLEYLLSNVIKCAVPNSCLPRGRLRNISYCWPLFDNSPSVCLNCCVETGKLNYKPNWNLDFSYSHCRLCGLSLSSCLSSCPYSWLFACQPAKPIVCPTTQFHLAQCPLHLILLRKLFVTIMHAFAKSTELQPFHLWFSQSPLVWIVYVVLLD